MKIVHLTTSGELGGAETSLLSILHSIRRAEPSWSLAVLTPAPGPLVERLRESGFAVRVLPFPRRLAVLGESGGSLGRLTAPLALTSSAAYAIRLASALRQEAASVVHAHGFKMHALSALARRGRAALVWHMHGYLSRRVWTARVLRALVPRASAVLANSDSVAEDVRRVLGPRAMVRTLYNAVDLREFSPDGDAIDLDVAAGLPPAPAGTLRVGLVGTFGRWKGQHVLVEAIAKLPRILPLRGYIIGAPIYTTSGSQLTIDDLRAAARERGVADRVGFTGFIGDVARAMRALDIVVHASTEPEPFGMVIAEAMACGRALIASRTGGAVELFREGVDAFGVRPGDADDLAARIQMLAVDPVLRARAGAAARQSAEARFDSRALASHLVPLYRTLAAAV